MQNNYDAVAWFYDPLSKLVFGKTLIKAQIYLLDRVPPGAMILIAGGGTGWILEELTKLHPSGLEITYVELSGKMIGQAKKREIKDNSVCFLQGAIEDSIIKTRFDVVITCFLFDNFNSVTAENVFNSLDGFLKPEGIWLFSDFRTYPSLHPGKKLLLAGMLFFFRLWSRIEARKLLDPGPFFSRSGYKILMDKTFSGGFIYSAVYKKS